jgi:hypothetical protein
MNCDRSDYIQLMDSATGWTVDAPIETAYDSPPWV